MIVKLSKKNSVLVSCGTKFHSDYMAAQLDRHHLLGKIITAHPPSRFLNRVYLDKKKVKFLPPIFLFSHLIDKMGIGTSRIGRNVNYSLPVLYDWIASAFVNSSKISITWAWAGLATIKKVKKSGGIAIIEECGSCNLFQNKVLKEEYDKLGLRFINRTPDFIVKRELDEIEHADYVLCPSRYVANSFTSIGVPSSKCVIIPYGANLKLFRSLPKEDTEFTILFVGTIGVRKGVIYLFQALEILAAQYKFKCLLIGSVEDQFADIFNKYKSLFTHIPRVPHHLLVDYYNMASVFVFPSIDEGMAYVQLEAMACGIPVICTPNSGGDSVIDQGQDGFIVPAKDAAAIANKIEYLFLNRRECLRMSGNALEKARQFSWDNYGDTLAAFINSL